MTNTEAAKIIDHLGIKQVYDDTVSAAEIGEALTLAISALESIDRITAERDALLTDLKSSGDICQFCKYDANSKVCMRCEYDDIKWEWRGITNGENG